MNPHRPGWLATADRVEVTPCAACPARHVVALSRHPIVTRHALIVSQALTLAGWRFAQVHAMPSLDRGRFAWICPSEEPSHAFVSIGGEAECARVVVEVAR